MSTTTGPRRQGARERPQAAPAAMELPQVLPHQRLPPHNADRFLEEEKESRKKGFTRIYRT